MQTISKSFYYVKVLQKNENGSFCPILDIKTIPCHTRLHAGYFLCILYFYMAATWCTYTNSTEKIHASVSERWTKTGYAVKARFSVTVKEEFCGAAKTEKTFNQQMQFCFYTTQKLSVKQHPQKGLILFKKTKHCHVKQLNLLPLNNHLTSMKTGKPVGCERYFPSRESYLSIGI